MKCKYCGADLKLDKTVNPTFISHCVGMAYCPACQVKIYKLKNGDYRVIKEQYNLT